MSILDKVKKGDNNAFAELIDMYKAPIYKTAKAILKDEDDVCDVLQDVALSIYKNIKNLKNEKYLKTWIVRITINKSYDIIAKRKLNDEKIAKVKMETNEIHMGFEKDIIEKTDLEKALDLLDEELKITTVLYYYDDLSVSEISDILNIPKGTVKSRIFRAREKLYEILSKKEVSINE